MFRGVLTAYGQKPPCLVAASIERKGFYRDGATELGIVIYGLGSRQVEPVVLFWLLILKGSPTILCCFGFDRTTCAGRQSSHLMNCGHRHQAFLPSFHRQHSSNVTPFPPNISNALPIVRSTFPPLILSTSSRSWRFLPPPAYVTGMVQIAARYSTSFSSIPACRPSASAAWIRNSLQ